MYTKKIQKTIRTKAFVLKKQQKEPKVTFSPFAFFLLIYQKTIFAPSFMLILASLQPIKKIKIRFLTDFFLLK